MNVLETKLVTKRFGGLVAVNEVSMHIEQGDIVGLIGPNGAGKTTMLKAITGVVHPQNARITLKAREISGLPTHRRIRLGLALTHQIVRPFRSMSLQDNVAFAAGHHRIRRVFKAVSALDRTDERTEAQHLLELVDIAEHAREPVTGQPLGILKRLEVARALALKPSLLLLDEPLAGLNHVEAQRLADTIARINKEGLTVVMIEHNLSEVLRISQRLVVLDNGRKIAEGDPREVMRMSHVRAAYVGKEEENAAA